jgi:hypothetical protein
MRILHVLRGGMKVKKLIRRMRILKTQKKPEMSILKTSKKPESPKH